MKQIIMIGMTCMFAFGVWAATTPIVGYVQQEEPNLTAIGRIVTLPPGEISPKAYSTREVTLKYHDAFFASQISMEFAGTKIDTQWVAAPDAKVDQVMIGDDELTILKDGFENGRLATKEYGEIPVFFYLPGMLPNSPSTNICILVFDNDQLQKIPREEPPEDESPM